VVNNSKAIDTFFTMTEGGTRKQSGNSKAIDNAEGGRGPSDAGHEASNPRESVSGTGGRLMVAIALLIVVVIAAVVLLSGGNASGIAPSDVAVQQEALRVPNQGGGAAAEKGALGYLPGAQDPEAYAENVRKTALDPEAYRQAVKNMNSRSATRAEIEAFYEAEKQARAENRGDSDEVHPLDRELSTEHNERMEMLTHNKDKSLYKQTPEELEQRKKVREEQMKQFDEFHAEREENRARMAKLAGMLAKPGNTEL
jgi:hypothetical protein